MNKKLTVKPYLIETFDDGVLNKLKVGFTSSFESGETHFAYSVDMSGDIGFGEGVIVSAAKEIAEAPVLLKESGEIEKDLLVDGNFGKICYGFIVPDSRIIITNDKGSFRKVIGSLYEEGGVRLYPLYKDKSLQRVLEWDFYKKLSIAYNFPTHDDLSEFTASKIGQQFKFIDDAGSLKYEATFSAPRQKQVLNKDIVQEIIKACSNNEFCTKIIVKGGEFETEKLEQIDIKNDQPTFSDNIEISNNFISPDEFLVFLRQAYDQEFQHYITNK